jgi:hypothetical protein
MIDENEIDATLIKIGKEYRWCIPEERNSFLYSYKDILSEKSITSKMTPRGMN